MLRSCTADERKLLDKVLLHTVFSEPLEGIMPSPPLVAGKEN